MRRIKHHKTLNLTFRFVLSVFLIINTAAFLALGIGSILDALGIMELRRLNPIIMISLFFVALMIIGTILSLIISKKSIKQVNEVLSAVSEIGKGNFDIFLAEGEGPEGFNYIRKNINIMAKNLLNLEIMRKDFIQNFSHEFKTPIVSMQGFAKRLLTKELTEEQKQEYLTIIWEESVRLSRLAENTLYMSKLDSLETAPEQKNFMLDEQLRQCVLLLEKEWTQKNINLSLDIPQINYYGNEEMIMQIWINLITNALKFSSDGGEIRISAVIHENAIIVSISDNGLGMSDEEQKHIFVRYYQGDSSRATHGIGLGLSIVQKIIELIDGSISVKSSLGQGTTFTVTLKINNN